MKQIEFIRFLLPNPLADVSLHQDNLTHAAKASDFLTSLEIMAVLMQLTESQLTIITEEILLLQD